MNLDRFPQDVPKVKPDTRTERCDGCNGTGRIEKDRERGHANTLAELGWRFTAWKGKDPTNEEWQGVGRKHGSVEIITHGCSDRTAAITSAKAKAFERDQDDLVEPCPDCHGKGTVEVQIPEREHDE